MEFDIKDCIREILTQNITASLSTIHGDKCHTNTIYYSFDDDLNLFFASDSCTEHCANIANNPNVAVAIWELPVSYGCKHKGVQIEGTCQMLTGLSLIKAWTLYIRRFPIFNTKIGGLENISNKVISMRLYKVNVQKIKVTDSDLLGNKTRELTI